MTMQHDMGFLISYLKRQWRKRLILMKEIKRNLKGIG